VSRGAHSTGTSPHYAWFVMVGIVAVVAAGVVAAAYAGGYLGGNAATVTPAVVETATAAVPTTGTAAAVETTPSAEPTPSASSTITITAVGDLLFDLGPRRMIAAKGGKAPLAKVASVLRAADLTIANLETPLSNRGASVLGKPANLIFDGDPRGVLSLTDSGIDIVSLANNHAMDHGTIALKDTLATLDKAGIAHAGAGLNTKAAWTPAIVDVNGRKVAYLAFTQIIPSYFTPSATRAGVATGTSITKMAATVRAAKKKADIVIVAVHWGTEQSYTPTARQKHDARALIDAGADVVLSHHPHVMQGIDTYKGKLIAYSLGNFLFPYKTVEGRKSFILRFEYGPKGVANITAVPVYLGEWGAPVIQTGASARAILGKLASISEPMGTRITIKNGIGYIRP
jgi:poly-gamma-glutamate synthesis protein (capsule biosynthesis protein)